MHLMTFRETFLNDISVCVKLFSILFKCFHYMYGLYMLVKTVTYIYANGIKKQLLLLDHLRTLRPLVSEG
jgi:hypothetical protein